MLDSQFHELEDLLEDDNERIRELARRALMNNPDEDAGEADDTDMDEIMYRLYVIDKIRRGQLDVSHNRTTRSDELKREIDSW